MSHSPRKFKLLIAYDGADFHGWQRQPGMRTVQACIEESARRVLRQPLEVVGSGRTDSGVHAAGQAAHVVATTDMTPYNIYRAIGGRLPEDICLLSVREAPMEFSAIGSAISKLYRYRIWNAAHRPVRWRAQRYCYHHWGPFDMDRARQAASHLIGEHDFAAFAATGHKRKTTVRTVLRCDISRQFEEIRIDVQGKGFLYNQVRNMVGTILEVARGHWPPERVPEILAGKDRSKAGPTAEARGLCLQWVQYPADDELPNAAVDLEETCI